MRRFLPRNQLAGTIARGIRSSIGSIYQTESHWLPVVNYPSNEYFKRGSIRRTDKRSRGRGRSTNRNVSETRSRRPAKMAPASFVTFCRGYRRCAKHSCGSGRAFYLEACAILSSAFGIWVVATHALRRVLSSCPALGACFSVAARGQGHLFAYWLLLKIKPPRGPRGTSDRATRFAAKEFDNPRNL